MCTGHNIHVPSKYKHGSGVTDTWYLLRIQPWHCHETDRYCVLRLAILSEDSQLFCPVILARMVAVLQQQQQQQQQQI
jgi:hypothetical protein